MLGDIGLDAALLALGLWVGSEDDLSRYLRENKGPSWKDSNLNKLWPIFRKARTVGDVSGLCAYREYLLSFVARNIPVLTTR